MLGRPVGVNLEPVDPAAKMNEDGLKIANGSSKQQGDFTQSK